MIKIILLALYLGFGAWCGYATWKDELNLMERDIVGLVVCILAVFLWPIYAIVCIVDERINKKRKA